MAFELESETKTEKCVYHLFVDRSRSDLSFYRNESAVRIQSNDCLFCFHQHGLARFRLDNIENERTSAFLSRFTIKINSIGGRGSVNHEGK